MTYVLLQSQLGKNMGKPLFPITNFDPSIRILYSDSFWFELKANLKSSPAL